MNLRSEGHGGDGSDSDGGDGCDDDDDIDADDLRNTDVRGGCKSWKWFHAQRLVAEMADLVARACPKCVPLC